MAAQAELLAIKQTGRSTTEELEPSKSGKQARVNLLPVQNVSYVCVQLPQLDTMASVLLLLMSNIR